MRDTAPRYDLLAALRALELGEDSPQWRASYERVVSDETREATGLQPSFRGGVFLPLPLQRDLSVASGGSYLVGQGTPGGFFMQSLVGASIGMQLGAQVLPMGKDNGAVPVVSTAPATQWLADETTQISTAQPTIGMRLSTPRALAALVTFSKQLIATSNPAVEQVLMQELGRACAAAVDDAIFNGSGVAGEPTGLLAVPGTTSASGASLDLADVADLIEDTVTAGSAMVSPGFAADGVVQEILLTRDRGTGTGVMLTDDATRLAGYPLRASKTGPASSLIFCDWSQIRVATWGGLELRLDPYTGFASGKISLRAVLYTDVLVAHPAAISIRTSVS